MTVSFITIMDIIGTIAFAISGAMVAIEKEMDIFGVNILAVTTAAGGGMLRDILIGRIPPMMFRNPCYVVIAVMVANIVFVMMYLHKHVKEKYVRIYEWILFLFDTLGLAAFTVDGVNAGMDTAYSSNLFLVVFIGVLTGVGGGLLRDIMANQLPYIFVKHIYASASLVGALLTVFLWPYMGGKMAMSVGFAAILIIRLLAVRYNWNLPRIKKEIQE